MKLCGIFCALLAITFCSPKTIQEKYFHIIESFADLEPGQILKSPGVYKISEDYEIYVNWGKLEVLEVKSGKKPMLTLKADNTACSFDMRKPISLTIEHPEMTLSMGRAELFFNASPKKGSVLVERGEIEVTHKKTNSKQVVKEKGKLTFDQKAVGFSPTKKTIAKKTSGTEIFFLKKGAIIRGTVLAKEGSILVVKTQNGVIRLDQDNIRTRRFAP